MTAEERLLENGYEGIVILASYSYDEALVGVTTDGQAVYDFDKMVAWLVETEGFQPDEAVEWVEYNTIRARGYAGPEAPIIMYPLGE